MWDELLKENENLDVLVKMEEEQKEQDEQDNGYGFYIDMEDIRDLEEEDTEEEGKTTPKKNFIQLPITIFTSWLVFMGSVFVVGQILQEYGRMSPFRIYSFYAFYTIYGTLMTRLVWTSPQK
jgi:hypothetical protein